MRLAAVKALQIVYTSSHSQNLLTSLNHFTERFKPRLVEMAEADIDLGVRVGVLNILEEIEKTGMLGEEEREKLGGLVFCSELRVRKAVGGFVRGVWEEWVEDRDVEAGGKDKADKDRMGIKGIAALLGKWGKALDEASGYKEDDEDGNAEDEGKRSKPEIASLVTGRAKSNSEGRIALATDALWDDLSPVTDWNGILDILLLDHSASADSQVAPSTGRRGKKKVNGKTPGDDDDDDAESVSVDDSWRLDEVEEGILLELLVASINRSKKDAATAKKVHLMLFRPVYL